MSDGNKIIALSDELEKMPGYAVLRQLDVLGVSVRIFGRNYEELKKYLVLHSSMPSAIKLWDVANREALHELQLEVMRLLHNFVASAQSLVDHSRNLHKRLCEPRKLLPEYQSEVDRRFASNPLAQFVVCLRQYCEHYASAPVFSNMHYTANPPELKSRLKLSKELLESFSGWKALAKQFLAQQSDSVDILDVVESYFNLVIDFQKWFNTRVKGVYSKELEALSVKQRELAELVLPGMVQDSLAEASNLVNPDKSFAAILTLQERKELSKYPPNSSEHCERLIAFLENRAPLNEELKNKIRHVYQHCSFK